ncbi:MAG: ABC transporter permease, partial [Lachnospiraceae bacterium]|nr:ABC transporter permease [Lachnospiraceae bacterium]
MSRERSFNMIRTLVSMLVAILVAFVIILAVSDQPVESIRTFLIGPFTSKRYIGNIVETAVPLIFSGLAMAIMFKANLFNLGGEGIFFISGIMGSFVAIWLKLPIVLLPLVCILAGIAAGMVVMLVPGALKAKYGANEMVTSLMMNNILLGLGLYFLNNAMRDPAVASLVSYKYQENALLMNIVSGTRVHIGFIIAIVCAVLIYLFMYKSKWGYEIRMTGNNARFAAYSGIKVAKVIVLV